jgi:hypothetical protein
MLDEFGLRAQVDLAGAASDAHDGIISLPSHSEGLSELPDGAGSRGENLRVRDVAL